MIKLLHSRGVFIPKALFTNPSSHFSCRYASSSSINPKALFISLYKNFAHVLMERLVHASADVEVDGPQPGSTDAMAVESDELLPTMDVDKENGNPERSESNGTSNVYKIGEQVQWCRTTLGYVKAFSRQYAAEIWTHIEKLDAEVFIEEMHPLFGKAVFAGLGRQI